MMGGIQFLYFLLITSILLLIGGILYYKYEKAKTSLSKSKKQIQSLENANLTLRIKEEETKEIAQSYLDILRKSISLSSYIADDTENGRRLAKIFNEIVHKQESPNSNSFYTAVNLIHYERFEKFKQKHPNLTNKEFQVCFLTYAKFSSSEIASIMNLKITTVQMKRSTIRKKIGIEYFGNIPEYIDDNYNK